MTFRKPRPSDALHLALTSQGPALVTCNEIFEHTIYGLIDITALRATIKAEPELFPTIPVALRAEDMEALDQYRELDKTRIAEFSDNDLEDPGIIVIDFSKSHDDPVIVPIDGHHRMWARYHKGKTDMQFYAVDHRVLESFRPDMSRLVGELEWGNKEIVDGVLKKVR